MYDARPNKLFGDGNLLFGVATIVVVGACFVGALTIPGLGGGEKADGTMVAGAAAPAMAYEVNPEALNKAMASPDEQRFLRSLLALAPSRYVALQRTFSDEKLSRQDQMAAIQEAATSTIAEHADILTYASGQSLNRLMDGAIRDLRTAQQSGSRFCQGATYRDIAGAPQAAVAGWAAGQEFSDEDFFPTAVRMNADILDLLRQAKTNPARHGLFSRSDEAELQRAMVTVMTDPAVMRVMMAKGDPDGALASLNLCSVGVKALSSLRALPDETKGRAWAAMLNHPKAKQALRTLQQRASS